MLTTLLSSPEPGRDLSAATHARSDRTGSGLHPILQVGVLVDLRVEPDPQPDAGTICQRRCPALLEAAVLMRQTLGLGVSPRGGADG